MSRLDEFDIVIRRRNNKVTAAVLQLNLFATGEDVNQALDRLERKKAEYLKDLDEAGEIDNLAMISRAARTAHNHSFAKNDLTRFTIKTAIVGFVLLVAVVVTATFITTAVRGFVDVVQIRSQVVLQQIRTNLDQVNWLEKFETQINQAADSKWELPEERKQRLLTNLRVIKERWIPYWEIMFPVSPDGRRAGQEAQKPPQ